MTKKVRLPDVICKKLLLTPESGMGYHNVKITLKNGKKLSNRIVVNSEYLILNTEENYTTKDFKTIEF